MIKKVLLINGPAGSGKDALGKFLFNKYAFCTLEKFAKPLKEANAVLYGFDPADLYNAQTELYKWDNDKREKETHRKQLGGLTWRQVNINLSESYIKKFGGSDFFGQSFCTRSQKYPHELFVITDSGFTDEARPVVDKFGKDCVFCIQIHADGLSFNGDSRSYIDTKSLGIESLNILNTFTPDFFIEAEQYMRKMVFAANDKTIKKQSIIT